MPNPAPKPPLWERLRSARVVQVLLVYLGASWAILQITETLQGLLTLPEWVGPVAVVLLLVGLVVVAATAWVQSLPQTTAAEEAGEVPTDWEVDAADVVASLKKGRLPHLTWGRAIVGGVVALSLLFGGAGLFVIVKGPVGFVGPQEAGAESAAQGIAVLPFHVTGDDLQVYGEGMVDLMSANLDGLSEFRAIDARTVLARWNRDIGEAGDAELDAALRVAAGTGARYAVVGSGVEAGGQIRFTAEIYDLSDGSQVGDGGQVEGSPEDVLGLVDALTVEVMRSVLDATGRGSSAQTFRLASLLTESVPALRHYLEGDALFRRTNFDEARESLERAIEEDSTFALAYWRLGETIGWTEGIEDETGVDAKRRAKELGDRLPDREATLLDVGFAIADGHAEDEVGNLRTYLRRYPDDPDGWYLLGEAGQHRFGPTGISDAELEEALRKAVELDPTFGPYYEHALQWAASKGDEAWFQELLAGQAEAGDDPTRRENALLRWDLLWGDDDAYAAALARLADRERIEVQGVDQQLAGKVDEGLGRLAPLWDGTNNEAAFRIQILGQQGRLEELLAPSDSVLSRPQTMAQAVSTLIEWHHLAGVSAERLMAARGELAPVPFAPFFSGLLAATANDPEYPQAMDELMGFMRQQAATAPPEALGDTVAIREYLVQSLEAERLAATGDHEAAYRLWMEARETRPDDVDIFPEWEGRLAVQAGEWNNAIRQLEGRSRAPGFRTTTKYWLGKAYEGAGDTEKALEAYRVFLARTADADPGLAPVEEVREAVARLGG